VGKGKGREKEKELYRETVTSHPGGAGNKGKRSIILERKGRVSSGYLEEAEEYQFEEKGKETITRMPPGGLKIRRKRRTGDAGPFGE